MFFSEPLKKEIFSIFFWFFVTLDLATWMFSFYDTSFLHYLFPMSLKFFIIEKSIQKSWKIVINF